MIRSSAKRVVRWCGLKGIVAPFAWDLARRALTIGDEAGDARYTLLALQPHRFRGDLELLAADPRFRVLGLPFEALTRLLTLFYDEDNLGDHLFAPDMPEEAAVQQAAFRGFLRRMLPRLYRRLGVNAVLGANVRYWRELDWGAVSNELGVPYVVIQRENLIQSPQHRQTYVDMARGLGRFQGSRIIVHNEAMRSVILEGGFATGKQVEAAGCMRMDGFLQRIDEPPADAGHRKKVVLFSFSPGIGRFWEKVNLWPEDRSKGMYVFFDNVHAAIGELARDNPHVDFVIKPKWGLNWQDAIIDAIGKAGIDPEALGNLTVSADLDPNELILTSDVVCSFGSTTLLEAGVAGRPVIVPMFDEARSPEHQLSIQFRDHMHLFDVAGSKDAFKQKILERLEDGRVGDALMAERKALFAEYVSPLDGNACARYADILTSVIE